jgi:hypothetical protein
MLGLMFTTTCPGLSLLKQKKQVPVLQRTPEVMHLCRKTSKKGPVRRFFVAEGHNKADYLGV